MGGTTHGECGARAYNGGLGAEPPSGGQGVKPPETETESILVIGCPTEPANLAPVRENSMLCYGPLVSELGAQSAWCPPNPVIGGPVPPGSAAYACRPVLRHSVSATHTQLSVTRRQRVPRRQYRQGVYRHFISTTPPLTHWHQSRYNYNVATERKFHNNIRGQREFLPYP